MLKYFPAIEHSIGKILSPVEVVDVMKRIESLKCNCAGHIARMAQLWTGDHTQKTCGDQ